MSFYQDLRHSEGVGRQNLRLVIGQDEKWEQFFAFQSACFTLSKPILYDITMRKFIIEKFGIKIENLATKWSSLCWNCFDKNTNMKKCDICQVALYCSKNCLAQDLKVHQILHGSEKYFRKKILEKNCWKILLQNIFLAFTEFLNASRSKLAFLSL